MVTQKGSRTLILICQQAFGGVIERMLRREGFADFQRGDLSLAGGAAAEPEVGKVASTVFVLVTDVSSARRLEDFLHACPLRGSAGGIFELWTVGD